MYEYDEVVIIGRLMSVLATLLYCYCSDHSRVVSVLSSLLFKNVEITNSTKDFILIVTFFSSLSKHIFPSITSGTFINSSEPIDCYLWTLELYSAFFIFFYLNGRQKIKLLILNLLL